MSGCFVYTVLFLGWDMRLPTNFMEWQEYSRRVNAIADRIYAMRSARGWSIARAVGIGRCMCSLHNCSIDVDGKGWAAGPGGPQRRKAARRALRLIDDHSMNAIARRIISRGWDYYSQFPAGDDSRQRQMQFS